jgi:hypothetical protein
VYSNACYWEGVTPWSKYFVFTFMYWVRPGFGMGFLYCSVFCPGVLVYSGIVASGVI